MPEKFGPLARYNDLYDNSAYNEVSLLLAANMGAILRFWSITTPQEQMHNVLMNLIIDAALERCGETFYEGRNIQVMLYALGLGSWCFALVSRYLNRFGPMA